MFRIPDHAERWRVEQGGGGEPPPYQHSQLYRSGTLPSSIVDPNWFCSDLIPPSKIKSDLSTDTIRVPLLSDPAFYKIVFIVKEVLFSTNVKSELVPYIY